MRASGPLLLMAALLLNGCAVAGLAIGGLAAAVGGAPPAADGTRQAAPYVSEQAVAEAARLADQALRQPVAARCTAALPKEEEEASPETQEAAPRCRLRQVCLPGAAAPSELLLCEEP